ncbi:MAG: L-2-hydroxyglutarate oxidase [SAR202 cluster bacterium]|nr:L-2-hydroxyglutarate oxidase [SAR202 cluster bacterium]
MDSTRHDIAIVGGGIIGLATAMRLAQEHPRVKVVVLEKEGRVAEHQTGHNSGVIHAGIYYAPGSQKANFCAQGGPLLRRFSDEHGIPYEMCGKLIVALTEGELPRLEELFRRGTANGAAGLEMIGPERLRELEPHAAGIKAILSPNTGIIAFRRVAEAYAGEFTKQGGELVLDARLTAVRRADGRLHLETTKGAVSAANLINCAGLHADAVARMMGVDIGVRIIPFRGEYFSIKPERAHLVRSLIYPVPDPRLPFLGVHFTKRITGEVEAGPNAVLAFAREGYRKTSLSPGDTAGMLAFPGFWRMSRTYWRTGFNEQYRSWMKGVFLRSLQTLVPDIRMDDLGEPGSGVRAQAVDRKGKLLQDFSIAETRNAIHVLNAPSPGATSSLTISRYIVDMARKSFGLN